MSLFTCELLIFIAITYISSDISTILYEKNNLAFFTFKYRRFGTRSVSQKA